VKITEKEVRNIAELAHLNLSDDEIVAYQGDMEGILSYVDKLNELPTDDVEPMAQVLFEGAEEKGLRDDVLEPSMDVDKALSNAPMAGAGQFKVPRVLER
jgi:aspartyl-tRNA(Asn)/glutamyl-tRNA(Gln) amidotransferase subunit C